MHGIKCAISVKRSTTVRIESKPLEGGRSIMKSNEIDFHGPSGIGIGCNKPYEWCQDYFDWQHVPQLWT